MRTNLNDRIFLFIRDVILFLRNMDDSVEMKIIKNQLIRSVSSTGANYEEAQGAASRADFSNKVRLCLKEIRETNFWLRLINSLQKTQNPDIELLINESEELKKIFGTIATKTKK